MTVTMDAAGRVVIPKAIRDAAGFTAGAPLEIQVRDGKVEIASSPPSYAIRTLPGGLRVAVFDGKARFDLVFSPKGEVPLAEGKPSATPEMLSLCRVRVVPIAGHVDDEKIEFSPASVGNPHAVVEREPARETLLRLGPLIENHERFPERTNVQLVRVDGPD